MTYFEKFFGAISVIRKPIELYTFPFSKSMGEVAKSKTLLYSYLAGSPQKLN